MLHHPNLAKAVGSDYLAARMKQLKPDVHIFGHTHFSYDVKFGGTRYVQWPLSYPAEQRYTLMAGDHKSFIYTHNLFQSKMDIQVIIMRSRAITNLAFQTC